MQKWKKAEKDFEAAFKALGKRAFVHRLTDTAAAKATSGKHAFVVAQPSDYLVVVEGRLFFAEVKSSSSATSFAHSGIRPSQLASARRVVAAGGEYFFFIKSEVLNKWFQVPAQRIFGSEIKSTPWTSLRDVECTFIPT